MLFKSYHLPLIRSGIKTETRRNWKRKMAKIGGIYPIQTKMFQQKKECELIRVVYMHKQKLGEMTTREAKKEGGYTLEEFKETFTKINGFWNDELTVYVIGFKYISSNKITNRKGVE